jgi:hypothetical protein
MDNVLDLVGKKKNVYTVAWECEGELGEMSKAGGEGKKN